MSAAARCERKHALPKFGGKRPPGECGGEMVDVASEAGEVHGKICSICGATRTYCQGCGMLFADLKKHLIKPGGEKKACWPANARFRTMLAAQTMGVGLP